MKKLILSLLIFCSAFVSAQISIPQVTGLPAALNSKVDKATGKSLIADTLSAKIQPHITNLSNPHSVTKSQVGLGNVDNTSDANKPISTATQSALNGKQASGTYSTDIHGNISALNSVSGINTGDETLTSIKTKLGAASAVSDGYLKYQDFALLHTPTTVTAANGLSISGQNISLQNASLSQSGALTFNDYNKFNSKEPAFSKNTAFNKNFGTTTGTVLEGRTFGTAANSAIGDFIQNGTGVQSANFNINGSGTFGTGATIKAIMANVQLILGRTGNSIGEVGLGSNDANYLSVYDNSTFSIPFNISRGGTSTFSSTTQSTSPTTGALVVSGGVGVGGHIYSGGNVHCGNIIATSSNSNFISSDVSIGYSTYQGYRLAVNGTGYFSGAVTASSFIGSGSNLTGVQLPITLTTNGTSGAATFENGVMNVPNYGASGNFILADPFLAQDADILIDGTVSASIVSAPSITTSYIDFNSAPNGASISGSVSGSVIFNMPFNGAYYKKVIINLLNLQGSASWTFTSAFANTPVVIMTDGLATSLVTAKSKTAVTVTSATPMSGILILEGY